jgi:hypothetical protein
VSSNTYHGQASGPQPLPPGLQAARQLRDGWLPRPVAVPFRLDPSEVCIGVADGTIEQLLPAGDGSYTHRSVKSGSLTGWVVGGTISAMLNAGSRAKAARDMADRWRPVAQARTYVTTQRIAVDARNDWWDIWYSDIRRIQYDRRGIILQLSGSPPFRLPLYPTDYWLVLIVRFVEGKIVDAPPATE